MTSFAANVYPASQDEEDEILQQQDFSGVYGSQSVLTQELMVNEESNSAPNSQEETIGLLASNDASAVKSSVASNPVVDTGVGSNQSFIDPLRKHTPGDKAGLRSLLEAANAIKTPIEASVETATVRVSPRLQQKKEQRKVAAAASDESQETVEHNNKKRPAAAAVSPSKAKQIVLDLTENDTKPSALSPSPKRRRRRQLTSPERQVAQQAAALVQCVTADKVLAKRLLLRMALERTANRDPPPLQPRGHELPTGFTWAHYPPLERFLREQMAEYYRHSVSDQKQEQQKYNNQLCDTIVSIANSQGWTIHGDRKHLRDRIRCYYKTHIQNAKKRLNTMLKEPMQPRNARALVAHWDLVADLVDDDKKAKDDVATAASSLSELLDRGDKKGSDTNELEEKEEVEEI